MPAASALEEINRPQDAVPINIHIGVGWVALAQQHYVAGQIIEEGRTPTGTVVRPHNRRVTGCRRSVAIKCRDLTGTCQEGVAVSRPVNLERR